MSRAEVKLPKKIINKQIKSVKVTTTKIIIEFFDTNCGIILLAIGDCCSSSTFSFNNETFMSSLLNKSINRIIIGEEIGNYEDDDREVIKISPVTITTDNGNVNFELINSSNGYYSGWIEIKKILTNN